MSGPRTPTFTIGRKTLLKGKQTAIKVYLKNAHNVDAFSFSLGYDPTVLTNPRVENEQNGTVLTVNPNVAGALGILVDSGGEIPAGLDLLILFDVTQTPLTETTLAFIGSPTPLSTSDGLGNLLKTVYKGQVCSIK